jgi:hypothetical protein
MELLQLLFTVGLLELTQLQQQLEQQLQLEQLPSVRLQVQLRHVCFQLLLLVK